MDLLEQRIQSASDRTAHDRLAALCANFGGDLLNDDNRVTNDKRHSRQFVFQTATTEVATIICVFASHFPTPLDSDDRPLR